MDSCFGIILVDMDSSRSDTPALESNLLKNEENPYEQAEQRQYDLPVETDVRASFAAPTNHAQAEAPSRHIRSLIASIFLIGGVIAAIVLRNQQANIRIGIGIGAYVFYLLLSLICNNILRHLCNIKRGVQFDGEYGRIKQTIGYFLFRAECYHYQTHHHTRTVRNSDGTTRTQHYTTTEKVITHTATENLTPALTRDESGMVDGIDANTNIIFISFLVNYRFDTPTSRQRYDYMYSTFCRRHCRDVHQDFSSSYIVPGLVEKQAFYRQKENCNMAVWLVLLAFLGLVWPISLWIESRITRFAISFMKVLSI